MIFGRVKSIDVILEATDRSPLRRSLGPLQLTLFGVGCVIGTGIFALVASGAQKAGPGLMLSFVIAGMICFVAALCYAELASMLPAAGSAYTYTYAAAGEILAWTVGWALVLEYAVSASAVSVTWSDYFQGTVLREFFALELPAMLRSGPLVLGGSPGGFINLPAVMIALLVTVLLVIGTRESARVNAVLAGIKLTALAAFLVLTVPRIDTANFTPFLPAGLFGELGSGIGAMGAAATIFFAYVGFDAVSTAAEETHNPQRNVPIGLLGTLFCCTVIYIAVAAGAIGTIGGAPIFGAGDVPLATGSEELARQCATSQHAQSLVCSKEALAHVLRVTGFPVVGNMLGIAAFLALPSVVLILIFGQARIFFVMARDGLLPPRLTMIHRRWRTPHVVTLVTGSAVGLAAAFLPVSRLADIANAGTLYAFTMVAVAALVLRRTQPARVRTFRAPALWLVGPLTIAGCVYLFANLPTAAMLVFPIWAAAGLVIYVAYGRRHSNLGRNIAAQPAVPPVLSA